MLFLFWRQQKFIRFRLLFYLVVRDMISRESVNLCCSIGIWWAKACVGVNVKGQSSTRKLCCVQCHAHSGAVHVQLVYRASNGYCKAHKIVICGGSGPEMWLDWWVSLCCLPLHRNYLGSHLWLTHPQDYFNGPIRTMWTQIFYKSQDDT